MSGITVTSTAPGKINLYFAVGEVAPNGYHPVASLYGAVSLHEEVTASIKAEAGISISLEIPEDSLLAHMEARRDFDRSSVPLDERNIAHSAALAVLQAQGLVPAHYGIHLHIKKNVPVAGGMAGGSADAAATLKAVNQLLCEAGWITDPLTQSQLLDLGTRLGADVPFCLLGGLAIGYGIGEELTPITLPPGAEPLNLVMVLNNRGLSTPAVFTQLDQGRAQGIYPPAGDLTVPDSLIDALSSTAAPAARLYEIARDLRNDLQAPALSLAPELHQTINLQDAPIIAGFVSGSGPTVALLLESPEAAQTLASALTSRGSYALAVTSDF